MPRRGCCIALDCDLRRVIVLYGRLVGDGGVTLWLNGGGRGAAVVAWSHRSPEIGEVSTDLLVANEVLARSSTLTNVGWIGYIVIGAIAGFIAGKIIKGSGQGLLMNIVVGIVGALLGGFILSFFLDTAGGGWWFTLFTAILGSVILLWILGKVQGGSSR